MTFVSYAQNFEDVMLWRALQHVGPGFYIDVGAGHPDECSVTRAFYDHGWHGLNVEPSEHYFHRLVGARPRDTNLQLALGTTSGETTLYEVAGTGLSTMDPAIAEQHRAAGWPVQERQVPIRRLADVWGAHAPGDVHFLKVDVEGAERDVLAGADFARFRPWIIVIEATRPLSQDTNHEDWESLLLENAYRFVWFDGLNRFFIAEEHGDLARFFTTPPNTFDDFIRAADGEYTTRIIGAKDEAREAAGRAAAAMERVLAAEQRAAAAELRAAAAEQHAATSAERATAAEQRAAAAEQRAATAEQRGAAGEHRAEAAAAALDEVHASNSWRLTAPLRAVGRVVRRSLRSTRFAG